MSFGAHQTFHIRDGWLRKGLRAISNDGAIFQQRQAADVLGIGTNMVDALRFWMVASGLAVETFQARWRVQHITPFGHMVMHHDPFFELDGTLWTVHAHLCMRREPATTWYWFFNHFARREFNKERALESLRDWAALNVESSPSDKTLERDIETLLHTYIATGRDQTPEDTLDCPLTALELIVPAGTKGNYQLQRPARGAIPALVVLWALLDWRERERPGQHQVSLAEVLTREGSPGRLFNLDAARLQEALNQLRDVAPDWAVQITRTAGLDVLGLPAVESQTVMAEYYQVNNLGEEPEVVA